MAKKKTERAVGQTRDVGFQVGARRTFSIPYKKAWKLLTSREGAARWLGESADLQFAKGATYSMKDGASGEVRVFKPGSHMRITWQPPEWKRPSTIQLRVIPKEGKTVIAFHQEHLPGPREREARRKYFASVLDELERIIGKD